MSKTADVFISYKSEEYGEANNVRKILTANGISCWMAPESIPMGSNYTQVIPAAIENCKVVVALLSTGSLDRCASEDDWVRKELEHAFRAEKKVVPIAASDVYNHWQWPVPTYEIEINANLVQNPGY